MNTVRYVSASFAPVGKYQAVKVPTGEKKKTLFGGEKDVTRKEMQWIKTGSSDCAIDGRKLANDLAIAIDELDSEGFEVVSVTPVSSGTYNKNWEYRGGHNSDAGYGWGYGYSYTEGLLVVAKKPT